MFAVEWHDLTIPLSVAAIVACTGWGLLVAALAAATRPHQIEPHSAGLEVGGDAPPAVAGMLTHHWVPRHIGAAATLIDLGARRIVTIEPAPTGGFQVRLPAQAPDGLLAYEQRVYDLAADKSAGGVVPCAALKLPEGRQTEKWFAAFGDEVAADARARGLSRRRYTPATIALMAAVTAIPAALIGGAVAAGIAWAIHTGAIHPSSHADTSPLVDFAGATFLAWTGLTWLLHRRPNERDTPDGLAEAGRWAGLAQNLRNDPIFCDEPVGAIAKWDRLLAYGVGLGVARAAARDVPISARSRNEAWSAETGAWRLVHIRYPEKFPPGYGDPPFKVVYRGLFQILVAAAVIVFGVPAIGHLAHEILISTPTSSDATTSWVRYGLGFAGVIVAIGGLVLGTRGGFMFVMGLADLVSSPTIEGTVLRVEAVDSSPVTGPDGITVWRDNQRGVYAGPSPTWHAAVDDGSSDHLRAWYEGGFPPDGFAEGARVRAMVGPHLGSVRHLEILRHAGPDPGTATSTRGESDSTQSPVGTVDGAAPSQDASSAASP